MKIAIYYVATKQYIMFFDAFKNGVENFFFPNVDKKIVLITDCDNVNFEEMSSSRLEIVQRHIDHYYWPIPTLFKMFYIEKFFASDCDFHFYCNANMEFTKEFSIEMPFGMCFMKHYLSDTLSLYTINNGNNNNCVIPPSWAKCHISNSEIPAGAKYCQAGFFGGTSKNVIHLLKNINEMIKDDLKHNIIPIWHDETYLNKYLLKFYWNHNVIGNVKIVDIRKYANLLNKNDYFDKFNL